MSSYRRVGRRDPQQALLYEYTIEPAHPAMVGYSLTVTCHRCHRRFHARAKGDCLDWYGTHICSRLGRGA